MHNVVSCVLLKYNLCFVFLRSARNPKGLRNWWNTSKMKTTILISWWVLYYRVLPLSSGVPFKLSCSHHYWCHISSSFPVRVSGGVHAVHQYCGALSRGHELQSSPPVRLHQACFGWLSRGMKLIKVLKVYSLYAHSETDGVFVHRGWSTLKVINSKCRSRHTWITCLMWGRF